MPSTAPCGSPCQVATPGHFRGTLCFSPPLPPWCHLTGGGGAYPVRTMNKDSPVTKPTVDSGQFALLPDPSELRALSSRVESPTRQATLGHSQEILGARGGAGCRGGTRGPAYKSPLLVRWENRAPNKGPRWPLLQAPPHVLGPWRQDIPAPAPRGRTAQRVWPGAVLGRAARDAHAALPARPRRWRHPAGLPGAPAGKGLGPGPGPTVGGQLCPLRGVGSGAHRPRKGSRALGACPLGTDGRAACGGSRSPASLLPLRRPPRGGPPRPPGRPSRAHPRGSPSSLRFPSGGSRTLLRLQAQVSADFAFRPHLGAGGARSQTDRCGRAFQTPATRVGPPLRRLLGRRERAKVRGRWPRAG